MRIFDKIEEILAAACLIVMTILTFANVVARYLFSASFSFSEEITTSVSYTHLLVRYRFFF